MENKKNKNHDCCDESCDCEHDHCDCENEEDEVSLEDLMCDIDPSKICDNCMKCVNTFNTDDKGYVKIGIDKVDKSSISLSELYKMYGLDDEE